jgi:hypothetical protein
VKSKPAKLLEIRDIEEKLVTLSSRVDHLENLSSRHNNNKDELQVVTTEQSVDVGKRQEQQVYTFLVLYFFIKKNFY